MLSSSSKFLAVAIALVVAFEYSNATTMDGLSIFDGSNLEAKIEAMNAGVHNPFREFNELVNLIFFQYLGLSSVETYVNTNLGSDYGYYFLCYLRDLVAGTAVYWITASLWHLTIYNIMGDKLFVKKGRPFPSFETISDQMALAQASIFVYAGLPILSEILIENKLTRCFFYLGEVGLVPSLVYFLIYIVLVEIGIYWMHRTLHTNKFLYKYIHALHHKYNKSLTLTPWASIAFNPIDGLLQASPYVIFLFFVPVNYFVHVFLLFFSGVWATNIHDAVWGDSEPIMGAKYHTVHHTHYHYNFGQFFIFCDYFFGTLKVPEKSKFD
mmetsp:Transcript_28494/g.39244  ORF Transcript_28494/g.39244 Transcript_28494/m.39244 type:complete len:325 (+) Transcript_28494:23-997(+)